MTPSRQLIYIYIHNQKLRHGPFLFCSLQCERSNDLLIIRTFLTPCSILVLQSGPQPAVFVWELSGMVFVSELKGHLYGVACLAFSPDGSYKITLILALLLLVHFFVSHLKEFVILYLCQVNI